MRRRARRTWSGCVGAMDSIRVIVHVVTRSLPAAGRYGRPGAGKVEARHSYAARRPASKSPIDSAPAAGASPPPSASARQSDLPRRRASRSSPSATTPPPLRPFRRRCSSVRVDPRKPHERPQRGKDFQDLPAFAPRDPVPAPRPFLQQLLDLRPDLDHVGREAALLQGSVSHPIPPREHPSHLRQQRLADETGSFPFPHPLEISAQVAPAQQICRLSRR
jgi:hypothetical protein